MRDREKRGEEMRRVKRESIRESQEKEKEKKKRRRQRMLIVNNRAHTVDIVAPPILFYWCRVGLVHKYDYSSIILFSSVYFLLFILAPFLIYVGLRNLTELDVSLNAHIDDTVISSISGIFAFLFFSLIFVYLI